MNNTEFKDSIIPQIDQAILILNAPGRFLSSHFTFTVPSGSYKVSASILDLQKFKAKIQKLPIEVRDQVYRTHKQTVNNYRRDQVEARLLADNY